MKTITHYNEETGRWKGHESYYDLDGDILLKVEESDVGHCIGEHISMFGRCFKIVGITCCPLKPCETYHLEEL